MAEDRVVVVSSAGRRLYLIDWLRGAFARLGIEGRVVIAENDPTSSSAAYGDGARSMPRYTDPAYPTALMELVEELRPGLFLSLNDYELMMLSGRTDLAEAMRLRGVLVPGVAPQWQEACADKLQMASLLQGVGVNTPRTVCGDDDPGLEALRAAGGEFVVKHRFGSGSSGLAIVSADGILETVDQSARTAPIVAGVAPSRRDVVVQPRLPGQEYGVDVVGDLGAAGSLVGTLVRRKLRMRAGETDKAVTVAADPFRRTASLLARASGLTGLIDVDMFLEDGGEPSVVDINPRFGGGYPFVHLAGADVPLYYVAAAFGREVDASWGDYEAGVVSAKFESVRVTARQ